MRLGAGVVIAFAVGAAAAGPWLPVGVLLAGLLALGAVWAAPGEAAAPRLRAFGVAAGLTRVVVFASAFGAYLLPGHPGLAAAVLVAVVTLTEVAGVRVPAFARRWITAVLLLAAAVLIALCLAIVPPDAFPAVGAPSPGGLLLAAAVVFPLVLPDRRDRPAIRVAGATLLAVAVAAAVLYQLGPDRLGLSATSMLDVLAAADASALAPVLLVVVVLATVPATSTTFADVSVAGVVAVGEAGTPRSVTVACGLTAVALAAFAGPAVALVLAAVAAFAELLAGMFARYRARRD